MAKKAKPKSKRTQVKDLSVTQQELTTDEASKVKGGGRYDYSAKNVIQSMRGINQSTTTSFNPK